MWNTTFEITLNDNKNAFTSSDRWFQQITNFTDFKDLKLDVI
jgi:hypothetical protein